MITLEDALEVVPSPERPARAFSEVAGRSNLFRFDGGAERRGSVALPNGHGPAETRRECSGCLGYLMTRPLARDHGILSVTALIRPLEYFDETSGGIIDTVAFFNTRRRT